MTGTPFKFSATAATFGSSVVEASATRPVLADFWAPWCGPCRTLMPLLDRIADDYGGRFALAKVNTDEEPQVAAQFGIRSIPTVILFHGGKAAEQFVGVQPEASIRALLDKYLLPASHGDREGPEALADAAGAQLEARDATAARATIDRLAASDPAHPVLAALRARAGFLEAAVARPDFAALRSAIDADPGDHGARHAIAAHHATAGDYATALAEWLELMRRDRRFGDELARRSMVGAFAVLGEGHELVASYRRRMSSLLH